MRRGERPYGPGDDESAGVFTSRCSPEGNRHMPRILNPCANAAVRTIGRILMRRNGDRPACVATRQRQDAEIHLSYTMIPPATGCSLLCYCEAPKRIGLTMVSILAAISSAGTRFGDRNQRRAAPKTAQAAVVDSNAGSTPGAIP